MNANYILITPAKNEEEFLPLVIKSVLSSNLLPVIWMIIDDDSDDSTSKIIKYYSNKYNFIKYFKLRNSKNRDLLYKYSYVCNYGFNKAIKIAEELNLEWKYITLLDADISINKDYFKKIIFEMEKDKTIGIASGLIHVYNNNRIKYVKGLYDTPRGGARIWRKECFLMTHGYYYGSSPDTVSNIQAQFNGWKTFQFSTVYGIQLRETSSAGGFILGNITNGKSAYLLNYHPLLLLFSSLYSSKFILYKILPLFFGYFLYYIKKQPKINDEKVKYYYQYIRIREIIRYFNSNQFKTYLIRNKS